MGQKQQPLGAEACIAQSYYPHVAVSSSEAVNLFANKLGFDSLLSILKSINSVRTVTIRTLQSNSRTIDDFYVEFCSPESENLPVTDTVLNSKLKEWIDTNKSTPTPTYGALLQEAWVKLLSQESTGISKNFESFAHPLTHIIALSTMSDDIVRDFEAQLQAHFPTPTNVSETCYNPDGIKCVYLFSDSSTPQSKINEQQDLLRREVGPHLQLLGLDWTDASSCLEALKDAMQNHIDRTLLPFMEECCSFWFSKQLSQKGGFASRFLGMPKLMPSVQKATINILESIAQRTQRLSTTFGSPIGNLESQALPFEQRSKLYLYLTSESQLRKIADMAFLLREYDFAHGIYNSLKKTFLNIGSWAEAASAQEFSVITYLLTRDDYSEKELTTNVFNPLEQCFYNYVSRCKIPMFAVRCYTVTWYLAFCKSYAKPEIFKVYLLADSLLKIYDENLLSAIPFTVLLECLADSYQSAHFKIPVAGGASSCSFDRKAAFWYLLAAKAWLRLDEKEQSQRCLELGKQLSYAKLAWPGDPKRALGSLESHITS